MFPQNRKIFGIVSSITVLLGIGIFFINRSPSVGIPPGEFADIEDSYVSFGSKADIKIEVADTMEEQALGLSGRASLKNDEGMLFVFENPGVYKFWMKDMKFPIDIIWIDESGLVIYIKKDARPEDNLMIFGPQENAKYVLEVVSGFTDKHAIKAGDYITNITIR